MTHSTHEKVLVHSGQEAVIPGGDEACVPGQRSVAWTLWEDKRPDDTTAMYRWRVPPRMVCGLLLQPEWSEKLALCGMGHSDSEWWPVTSDWNGYTRSVATGLEWRLAEPGETDPTWVGLDLLPDPWTGLPPRVSAKTRWVSAPCYIAESFSISHRFGTSYGWTDGAKMVAAWNARAGSDQ